MTRPLLSEDEVQSLLANAIGYDGGLQTVNEADLNHLIQQTEARILAKLAEGVEGEVVAWAVHSWNDALAMQKEDGS